MKHDASVGECSVCKTRQKGERERERERERESIEGGEEI